ncbi:MULTISPECIES: hypothetical protein [Bacteroidales]|uniref:hypothetical protein n=1 Tax=Bacteroides pyogenes TaxID=310300 RepID=UPI002F931FC7
MSNENKLQVVASQQMQLQPASSFNFFDPVQFDTMQRVCKLFANSELVPDMYKVSEKNPIEKAMANCMIAIEISQRIGASPLMVMQNMVPIYGKPSWSSKFLVATVNTCGRFTPLQFRFTEKGMLGMVDYTDYVWDNASRSKRAVAKQFDGKKMMDVECVAFTTAKGSDKVLESSPISIRLAIQEGWFTKNGSKWQTMTKQMLMYRAASFWTSVYAPELSMGMRTVEENQDIIDTQFEEVEEVEQEKANNANKVQIGMDLASGEDKTGKVVVSTETGKIVNETEAHAANEQAASPGF